MTTAPSPCISGCTVRGDHRTTCETRDAKVDPCKGCLPRDAETGLLCAWCFQRLQSDVATAPALIRHLRAMAQADAGADTTSDVHTGGDPAWGSILSAAIDAADEIHAMLASWAHLVLEEHPHGPMMRGPDERGARRTHTVAVLDGEIADVYGPYLRKSTVAGLDSPRTLGTVWVEREVTAPVSDSQGRPIVYVQRFAAGGPITADPGMATSRLVSWLLPMLLWCAAQDWAGEMRREVSSAVRTTLARWPMDDTATRHIPATACPRCDLVSLTYTPPTWERQPFVVRCTNPECGRVFSEDEWTRLCALLGLAERRMA